MFATFFYFLGYGQAMLRCLGLLQAECLCLTLSKHILASG